MNPVLGESAAILTALCFSLAATANTMATRQVGPLLVNQIRLLLAATFVIGLHWLITGQLLPFDARVESWFWLGTSGVIGLVLGDTALFRSFALVGPALAMLMMALAPIIAAVFAFVFIHEELTVLQVVGIIVTVAGVMSVVTQRQQPTNLDELPVRVYMIGILYGLLAAIGQAGGLLTARVGLEGMSALSGLSIRLLTAMLILWAFMLYEGHTQMTNKLWRIREHPASLRYMTMGVLIGPMTGVWLSLVAIQNAPVGIVTTLSNLTPVFLLPISYIAFKQPITHRAAVGTVIAVGGSALFFI